MSMTPHQVGAWGLVCLGLLVTYIVIFAIVDDDVPEAPAVVASDLEPVTARQAEPATQEPEEVVEEPPPAKKPLNMNRCRRINKAFIGCGWRCVRGRRGVGQCINACGHFLTRRGKRCLQIWGPGFG